MPKVVDPDQQREAIRDAARRVFTTRGIESTGLAHVAEAAGMGRSSLYHYYADKDSLIRDLAKDLLDREEEMFKKAQRREGAAPQRILALFDELTTVFDAWVAIGTMVMDLRRLDPTRFRTFFRRIRRELAQLILEGQKRGEIDPALKPEAVAAILIGMVDGLLFQKLIDPGSFKGRSSYDAMCDAVRKTLHA
jgi:AcrR family transcriptional regulator